MAADLTPLTAPPPTFREALRFWLKLGFISFGGPAGQIAIMHSELVERRRWISEDRFLHALNYCMLLPGPEAQQLATYVGWLLHRTRGGLAAGLLFVLPSVFVLWALSYVYVTFGDVKAIAAAFDGIKPAVLAIVASAGVRLARRTLRHPVFWTLAIAAFAALTLDAPFPLIVGTAGVIGWIGTGMQPEIFRLRTGHDTTAAGDSDALSRTPGRAAKCLAIGLTVWLTPIAIAGWVLGTGHTLFREGVFFSKAALVTFGGAYAVLPYVAQRAVEDYGWLAPGQMMDGLGLAETTPGPLIMVVQFVGFVGAWQHPGALPPLLAATLGALMTTWVTFAPCFLWIFLGAPHIERLRGHARLEGALSAVTAAVVGVIWNLAVWFGWHTLWPDVGPLDVFALVVAAVALYGLVWRGWGVVPVILAAAALRPLLTLLTS